MATVFTIGFTKKSAERFFTLLEEAEVDAVVDTRLRPNSQLSGFAKQRDLPFFLKQWGIAYEHYPELAPSREILDGYRKDRDWENYVRQFRPLIEERAVEKVGAALLERYRAPCLLCSEHTPNQCHRRLIAEYWAEQIPELKIIHLL